MIIAVITMKDHTQVRKLLPGWDELCLWMMKHHGEYEGMNAEKVKEEKTHE